MVDVPTPVLVMLLVFGTWFLGSVAMMVVSATIFEISKYTKTSYFKMWGIKRFWFDKWGYLRTTSCTYVVMWPVFLPIIIIHFIWKHAIRIFTMAIVNKG